MGVGHVVRRRGSPLVRIVSVGLWLLGGCARERAPSPPRDPLGAPTAVARLGPTDSLIPAGPLGAAIRRGRALLVATRDSLSGHVGNSLRCVSCHLDEGRREATGSWVGVDARYPQYRARSATVETIQYRINDCFRRSMNGKPLAVDGVEMRDMVAYLWFLSRDVPIAPPQGGNRLQKWAALTADTAAGTAGDTATCAKCHGSEGQGSAGRPPLWGRPTYNVGAGMTRVRTAAAFIRENMPLDQPGTLTDQQAFDVAAHVSRRPRPDFSDQMHD